MRVRTIVVGVAIATAAVLLQPAVASAMTPRATTVTTGGIKQVSLYTYRDSTEGWITFRIKDRARQGANVSQCDVLPNGNRTNCDSYRLRPMDYRGGAWKVRRTSDGWEIRIYVGYYAATSSNCWDYRNGVREGVQIGILTSRERLLDRQTHYYQLRCDGVAARSSAPANLVTRPGKASLPYSATATVIDRRHIIKSVRQCFYDVETKEFGNCYNDSITKVAKRTGQGWSMTSQLSYKNTSARQCTYYAREKPRQEFRTTFKDADGDTVGSTKVSFRLTCRR